MNSVVYLIRYFAAGDSLRVRRVALDLYPWFSQEALRRRCLDHPTHPEPKGKGENSLLRKAVMSRRYVCSCMARSAHTARARLPEAQFSGEYLPSHRQHA